MSDPASLAGWEPDISDADALIEALSKAVDFRGDVTITLRDGGAVEGYAYNLMIHAEPPVIELLPATGADAQTLLVDDITHIVFSTKDPAAGMSFEAWLKKYEARKREQAGG